MRRCPSTPGPPTTPRTSGEEVSAARTLSILIAVVLLVSIARHARADRRLVWDASLLGLALLASVPAVVAACYGWILLVEIRR